MFSKAYESENKNNYVTSVMVDCEGTILGKYRKRKPVTIGSHDAGNSVGFWDCQTKKGKLPIAIMICFDIENEDVFKETMEKQPRILLNPTFISAPFNKSFFMSNWKIALETMSGKFERIVSKLPFCFSSNKIASLQILIQRLYDVINQIQVLVFFFFLLNNL